MQFITSLFGGSGNTILTAVFALGIVLVLIVLGVWLLKLVFSASTNVARGRNRRLGVIESMMLDSKRQLIIIRRDNVEHLILTGGPQDVVVETGIPVEDSPAGLTTRRAAPAVNARNPLRQPAPVVPVVTPEQHPIQPSAMERLRGLGGPAGSAPAPKSLRHTGLLRATEPVVPDNSDQLRPDSAKEDAARTQGGSAELGDDDDNPHRQDRIADRN